MSDNATKVWIAIILAILISVVSGDAARVGVEREKTARAELECGQ